MKQLITFVIYIVAIILIQLLGIWWLPVIAAIALGFYLSDLSGMTVFSWGLFGMGLVWAGWSIYSNNMNDGLLAGKMGALFNGLSGMSLIAITTLLGGLLCGLGAITGKYIKEALES